MTYKWNSADVETYAKAFSNLICNEYFQNQKTISGGDILKITEIKQLNLLVIRNLFEKWQEESSRLKSPFFDFENEEVKIALKDFMNTLSKFISVSRDKFESLLAKSVQDTLQLAIEPKGYFENLMRNLPEFKLTAEWINANKKYFLINKDVLTELESKLSGGPIYANQGIESLSEIFNKYTLEDASEILEDFDGILKLTLSSNNANKSFFEEAFEASISQERKLQPSQEKPDVVIQPAMVMERPEPVTVKMPTVEKPVEAYRPEVKFKAAVTENISFNDRLLNGSQTLNDKRVAETNTSLLDSHSRSKINSLKSGVSLNQRFLFINNLFSGNQDAYNRTIEALDTYSSLTEAMSHVNQEIASRFQWDSNSAEAEEFYALIERKFN